MTTGRGHFIDRRWLEGAGAPFSSTDPATGETTWEGRAATAEEIDAAVAAARAAFGHWAETPLPERARCLEAFRGHLVAHRGELAGAISRETGKPAWEAVSEVDAMAGKIGISVEAHEERCRTVRRPLPEGAAGSWRFRPHGAIAVLGPFNMPGHLPNGQIVPALLAGNAVVFKPSEQAPLVAEMTLSFWEAAGLPRGVLNMVQGGRETGRALAEHPGLSGLFFTGSAAAGKAIHRIFAGRPEILLALEMGGNNPLVVFEVSDLTAAAYATVLSAYLTAGQRCTCARRLIVPAGREGERFVARLVAMTTNLRVGRHDERPEPFMGPVISRQAAETLLEAQEMLKRRGGDGLAAMAPRGGCPALLTPGLMDVTAVPDRPDVEYFGPFLQLVRVPDADAALREANNTAYGLAAGLLSDDERLYARFSRAVRAGVLTWNRQTTGASGSLPFGGTGASGSHRPGGYFAADSCSFPVAAIEMGELKMPVRPAPGIVV